MQLQTDIDNHAGGSGDPSPWGYLWNFPTSSMPSFLILYICQLVMRSLESAAAAGHTKYDMTMTITMMPTFHVRSVRDLVLRLLLTAGLVRPLTAPTLLTDLACA